VRGQCTTGASIDVRVGRDYRNPTARRGDADPRNVYEYLAQAIRFTSETSELIQIAALLGSFADGLNQGDTSPWVYLAEDPSGAEVKGSPRQKPTQEN